MAVFAKTKDDIVKDSINFIKNNTSLTSTSPGSVIRSIIEMNANLVYNAYSEFDKNFMGSLIYGATGKYLDYLGAGIAGLTRGKRTYAFVSSDANVIKFYVSTGTFGNINSGNDITILAGAKVWAVKNGIKVNYEVLSTTVLASGDSEKYISVRALEYGSSGNVEANTIINHELAYPGLKVTNIESISGAQDEESDESFRYRIANNSLAIKGGNDMSLRLAALSVPGVSDVILDRQAFGIGTVGIFVKSTTTTASSELIANVQSAVDGVKSDGIKVIVSAPEYIPMEFDIVIRFKDTASASDRQTARNDLINDIAYYVNNLAIGEEFDNGVAAGIALASNINIKSIGSVGKFFDKIKIKYPLSSGEYSYMEILSNYTPSKYQKLIIENNTTAFRIS